MGGNGASAEMIESRITTFPRGQVVAVSEDGAIVGYLSLQFVHTIGDGTYTWDELTDHGTIRRSHIPDGPHIYGVNLTGHPKHPGVGLALQLRGWVLATIWRRKGGYVGSRIPSLCRLRDKQRIEEWVIGRNGRSRDPEVRYYQTAGFKLLKLLPGYFPDPESLNYGALMYARNPFCRLPLSKFWAFLISRLGYKIIRVFEAQLRENKQGTIPNS